MKKLLSLALMLSLLLSSCGAGAGKAYDPKGAAQALVDQAHLQADTHQADAVAAVGVSVQANQGVLQVLALVAAAIKLGGDGRAKHIPPADRSVILTKNRIHSKYPSFRRRAGRIQAAAGTVRRDGLAACVLG